MSLRQEDQTVDEEIPDDQMEILKNAESANKKFAAIRSSGNAPDPRLENPKKMYGYNSDDGEINFLKPKILQRLPLN